MASMATDDRQSTATDDRYIIEKRIFNILIEAAERGGATTPVW